MDLGVSLVGGLAIPLDGLGVILGHALAVGVHAPEVELGLGVSLVGGLAVPLDGLGVILGHSQAVGVHEPEEVLGGGIPLLGEGAPLSKRRRVVAPFVCRHALVEPRPCWYRKDRHQQSSE